MKKIMYKLSPELGNGTNYQICDSQKSVLAVINNWFETSEIDDEFSIEKIEMTDEELSELPDLG